MASLTLLFDGIVAAGLVFLAWRSLQAPHLFTSVVLFIAFGLLMALAWVRLDASDIALAEAAIGAGITVFGIAVSGDLGGTRLLAAVAAVTIIYGSVRALAQDEIKRRLAFSTVSQISYIVLGAALGGPIATIGAFVQIVHRGLMKITLFFCAGNLAEMFGIHHVTELNGIGRRMPWTMTAFTIAAFGMIGLPPFAGFISKWYLAGGAIAVGAYWVVGILVVSSVLNSAYFLPLVYAAWFRPLAHHAPPKRPIGWWLIAPPLVTAALSIGAGLIAASVVSPLQWAEVISEPLVPRPRRPGVDWRVATSARPDHRSAPRRRRGAER